MKATDSITPNTPAEMPMEIIVRMNPAPVLSLPELVELHERARRAGRTPAAETLEIIRRALSPAVAA